MMWPAPALPHQVAVSANTPLRGFDEWVEVVMPLSPHQAVTATPGGHRPFALMSHECFRANPPHTD